MNRRFNDALPSRLEEAESQIAEEEGGSARMGEEEDAQFVLAASDSDLMWEI